MSVNERGQVVGWGRQVLSYEPYRIIDRACAWEADGTFILLHAASWSQSYAQEISDEGVAVGRATPAGAVRWSLRVSPPSCQSIVPLGLTHTAAVGLADNGLIGGGGHKTGVGYCATLGTPTVPPLPEALVTEWTAAAEAAGTAIGGLPGPGEARAAELPPPPEDYEPPEPPPPAGEDPYAYVSWDVVQDQGQGVLPEDTYTAFVVPNPEETPETLLLVTRHAAGGTSGTLRLAQAGDYTVEAAEMYTPNIVGEQPPGDETKPVVTGATATPGSLWPPDHRMVAVELAVSVTDDLDPQPTWYIETASSNQPVNGEGDGNTAPDWLLNPDKPQAVSLRAERAGGQAAGRVYTVVVRAIDSAGNVSEPFSVAVPVEHDQGAGATTQITSLSAAPTRGRTVQVVFGLSAASEVEAEVLNIAGRRVKALVRGRECEAGTNSLVWNCRSDQGLAVPNGTYLIRLTARTADGQQASRLCTAAVRR